jgi:hypothetical protein
MDSVHTPEGLLLASGSQDNKIRLWKVTRLNDGELCRQPLACFRSPRSSPLSVAGSPDTVAARVMAKQAAQAADDDASEDDEAADAPDDEPDELAIHLLLQEGSQRCAPCQTHRLCGAHAHLSIFPGLRFCSRHSWWRMRTT